MWFGTFDGLNSYDGKDITVFRNVFNDNNSLSNNWISGINGDHSKNICIGTKDAISISMF